MNQNRARISALAIYPVKGMKGIETGQATLTARGLLHDRSFMVVRGDGRFVTQRDLPRLALVKTGLDERGLTLEREGCGQVFVPFDVRHGQVIATRVWKDPCTAIDQGDTVAAWLSEALDSDEPLRLVAMQSGFTRELHAAGKLGEGTHTLFADAAPFLVAGESSLDELNLELGQGGHDTVPMNRFRPNIVVSGLPAWGEHAAGELDAGRYRIGLRYPCERCVVTTTDQSTAVRDPGWQPYRTLAAINPMPDREGKPAFGQNAVLLCGEGETIAVGDPVRLTGQEP